MAISDRARSFLIILLASGVVTATPGHAAIPAKPSPAADARLQAVAANYPGVAFAVADASGVVWQGAHGVGDVETGSAMTSRTPISAYSVNKAMTATVAMSLVETGRLDLDRPIGAYAKVPALFATLSARALLTHTAGVRHYRDGEWLPNARRTCSVPGEGVAAFASDPLGPPGIYRYSSFGYVLLSQVLEDASGRRFNDLMREHIFDPAGMTGASMWLVGLRRPPNGHERRGSKVYVARAIDNSCKFGAGAVIATAEDLARFGAALANGRLVSMASWRGMTADASNTYGLGWGVGALDDGSPVATHSGTFAKLGEQ